jgi:thioredoxin 1
MPISVLDKDPKTALKGKPAAVVVFYVDWCGDCKASEVFEERLAADFAGKVEFFRLDAAELDAIADAYEIERYPTWVFFSRARPLRHRLVEPLAEGEARNWLEMRLSDHRRNMRK